MLNREVLGNCRTNSWITLAIKRFLPDCSAVQISSTSSSSHVRQLQYPETEDKLMTMRWPQTAEWWRKTDCVLDIQMSYNWRQRPLGIRGWSWGFLKRREEKFSLTKTVVELRSKVKRPTVMLSNLVPLRFWRSNKAYIWPLILSTSTHGSKSG